MSLMAAKTVSANETVVSPAAEETGETETAARVYNRSLSLNRPVTAKAQYSTMPASYLTDADKESRWSSEMNATPSSPVWAWVDLGERYEMNYFSEIWEKANTHPGSINIYVSDSTEEWGEPVVSVSGIDSASSEQTLDTPVAGRYVKLEITSMVGYPSASARDFTIMLKDDSQTAQDPQTNVALGVSGTSSSNEVDYLNPSKLVDGNRTDRQSRWSCTTGEASPWVSLNLGQEREIRSLVLVWETRKATSYSIELSDDGENWTSVYDGERPAKLKEKIDLGQTYRAQYVRLNIHSYDNQNPDKEDDTWPTISLYEIEVYGGVYQDPDDSIEAVKDAISIEEPAKGDTKLKVSVPESELFDVTYNGTDYEQIIGADLSITEPLVDTEVTVNVKIVTKETGDFEFVEKKITVPGKYSVEEGDNEAITTLPELREWKGLSGTFTPNAAPKIVIESADFEKAAQDMAADYEELFGVRPSIEEGSEASAGDFLIRSVEDPSADKVNEETYELEIGDSVIISASTSTGAYWGTRSVLQGLKATQGESLNRGLARDYPMYSIRGIILDVGRKSFTLDFLKDLVKQVSWYKLNDFHVHLNDNEFVNGNDTFENFDNVYTGFRLESDVKAGGNDGLNQRDLTSKDVYYTKDEFRDFIKESRSMGVNIVPEFDSPAHSAAFTKVRPDLALGEGGRIDHLDLINKFDASTAFIQSIFDEYMTGENPVFDQDTVVHIGADEYNANSPAYRKFVNAMLSHVEETGHKARVWGSFSQCRDGEAIDGTGVEIDLWNAGYADMYEMYNLGFDLINCNDGNYYIVPNAGYYYDYLYDSTMYNLPINEIGSRKIPAGDKLMKGGSFALWNDKSGRNNNGVSMYDAYDRLNRNLPLFAAKLWGKKDLDINQAKARGTMMADAPGTDFNGDAKADANGVIAHWTMLDGADQSGNAFEIIGLENASLTTTEEKYGSMNALRLNGGSSYAATNAGTAGIGNDLRVKVLRLDGEVKDQVLFESEYGQLKAVQGATGKVGFSREKTDYSFNYELPVGKWVELEFKNENKQVSLYVNGKLQDVLGDDETMGGRRMESTNMYPISFIGAKENAFNGYVADVRVGTNDTFASAMNLQNLWLQASLAGLNNADNEVNAPELQELSGTIDVLGHAYKPEGESIAAAEETIQNVLNTYPYRKADLSKAMVYQDLAGDLDGFTAESADRVRQALANVELKLPYAMQEQTDQAVDALSAALDGLEIAQTSDLTVVDRTTLRATSSTNQSGEGPEKAIDGDPNTMWHCDWNNTTLPHWLDLQMSQPTEIKGITFTPRSNLANGTPKAYEIQISTDGTNYQTVKSGSCSMTEFKPYTFEFDPVTAVNVRFVITASVGNFGSCAEMTILKAHADSDLTTLNALITRAGTLNENLYTAESWTALQDKLAEANTLAGSENPDPNATNTMIRELRKAICTLKAGAVEESTPVVLESLQAVIAQAQAMNPADHPGDAAAFNAALEAAKAKAAALENGRGTKAQYEADLEAWRLNKAIEALDAEAPEQNADKTLLNMAIAYAEGLEESVLANLNVLVKAELDAALANAKTVSADAGASQSTVNSAWARLAKAIQMLNFTSDKSALKALLVQAQTVYDNLDAYQEEGKEAFIQAFENAKAVDASDTALDETIAAAVNALQAAMDGLHSEDIDTTLLAWLIDQTKDAEESLYTPATWTIFKEALTNAQSVLENPASQAAVDAAADALHNGWLQLRLSPSEDMLKALASFVETIDSMDLSSLSVNLQKTAISLKEETKAALANENLTKEEAQDLINRQASFLAQAGVKNSSVSELNNQAKPNVSADSVKTAAGLGAKLSSLALCASALMLGLLGARKRRK